MTAIANDAQYNTIIIRPSQSQSCVDQRCSSKAEYVDDDLSLSQFVNNSINYLINDTRLIFLPGNYSLESNLLVENIHSLSIFAWPISSSKTVITCGHNVRFEFRNISIVTVSGLEFIECFENHMVSVGHFQLENSGFFGNGQAIVNGSVLIIEESTATLDSVVFLSAVNKLQTSAGPQEIPQNCTVGTVDVVIGILLRRSNIRITQSRFEGNNVGLGAVIYDAIGSDIIIIDSTFVNNSAAEHCNNNCCLAGGIVYVSKSQGSTVKLYHSKFEKNVGVVIFVYSAGENVYTSTVSITHSEFIDNIVTGPRKLFNRLLVGSSLVYLDAVMITVNFSKFANNRASFAVVYIPHHYIVAGNLTNNVFSDNSAAYEVFVSSNCQQGLALSLGSNRCVQCSENWCQDLIGIVIAAIIAGILLVIITLALNMTVAVGTLNGIFFYANIVAANADTYFSLFKSPDIVTVFISWLNLDIGFDICFSRSAFTEEVHVFKALIRLAFPAYVILLVVIVIVASEYSSKFAKIIGKGNPVSVLATMILLSCVKLLNTIISSLSLLYWQPGYSSRNVDITVVGGGKTVIEEVNNTTGFKILAYFSLMIIMLLLLLCVVYIILVFSWQWLLRYQDRAIFNWVKYQKLRHFLEPYHAPYNGKYRYWTGLLLFVRAFLYTIAVLNFSLDPRVELMSVILIVGVLIFLKGVIAKRVYKNRLIDVMEVAIYFNLVAFSALTWYNLDFGGNQVAVAYTSVMNTFILLLVVIVFHVLRYTRLYKWFFVEKSFKWIFSKLIERKPRQEPPNNAPEELDGYQLERFATGDQELPTITYSVIDISQSAQNPNQEE